VSLRSIVHIIFSGASEKSCFDGSVTQLQWQWGNAPGSRPQKPSGALKARLKQEQGISPHHGNKDSVVWAAPANDLALSRFETRVQLPICKRCTIHLKLIVAC
jgi:hypothetical protein